MHFLFNLISAAKNRNRLLRRSREPRWDLSLQKALQDRPLDIREHCRGPKREGLIIEKTAGNVTIALCLSGAL